MERENRMDAPKPATGFRWTVCALIFFATTVNYLDRQIFSLLVPFFENDLKLGPTDLALINVSFILPYGFAMIFVGRFIDRVGVRKGLAFTFLLWNLASAGHALVRSLTGFMGIRFLLGIGESAMYPAGVKTMTDWFPARERALATGIFNAGANLGAVLAPLIGVALAEAYGWRMSFVATGCLGLIWLLFWRRLYRPPDDNPKVSASELAYIRSDALQTEPPLTYRQLFGLRPVYGLGIAKALTDAPWWFYLTWIPKILVDQFHVTPGFMAIASATIYVVADGGSIAGGWLSSSLIQRGRSIGKARKLAMLVCAVGVVPIMSVGWLADHTVVGGVSSVFLAVGVVALAAGAHQGWSSNLFTLISDTVPKNSMAMAVGAINGFAMIGVSAMQFFVGRTVALTSSYNAPFIVCGCLYLIALVIVQLFVPKVEQVPATRKANMVWVVAGGVALLAGLLVLQYEANRPAYNSIQQYLALRQTELSAGSPPQAGPAAKVGWMQARWFLWRPAGKPPKLELVKLDVHGHPYIEAKGDSAARYVGPSLEDVKASLVLSP